MNCVTAACPPLDPGGTACHCSACHQTFSGVGLFDTHQQVRRERPGKPFCLSARALGLVQAVNGTWWTPEGLLRSTERVARMHSAKVAA